ncbi:MAG: cyclase/dehydrase [Pantanalinema sp. GBBB05]|nr:cyclase/dehydrase [Pantanalinema sp. GBBB05]
MKPLIKLLLLLPCMVTLNGINWVEAADAERSPVPVLQQQAIQFPSSRLTQAANQPVLKLSSIDRLGLKPGQAVVTGNNGKYTARILIQGTVAQVWSVLTDYDNYENFMPNMTASKVVSTKGNQYVVEQVDRYRILLFTTTARTRLSITETPQESYSFQMMEGKLQKLQGRWSLQPIVDAKGSTTNHVLVTATIEAQPLPSTPKDIFFNLFQNTLRDRLQAVNTEVRNRSRRG